MLPVTSLVFVVPFITRRLGVTPVSGNVVGVGVGLTAVGIALMTWSGASTTWLHLLPGLLLAGLGIGIANPAIAATALAVVPPTRSGLAAGVSNTCRIAGVCMGTAALGALLQAGVTHTLTHGNRTTTTLVSAGLVPPGTHPAVAHHAFVVGFHWILVISAIWVALGAVASFTLVGRLTPPQSAVPQAAAVGGATPG
jgi:hypothetical protein